MSPWNLASQAPINITVSWPSLYNPGIELTNPQSGPTVSGGSYLYQPDDIFKFTLYWTLIFHIPFYLACGTYAFFNFTFPPHRRRGIHVYGGDPMALSLSVRAPTHAEPALASVSAKPPRPNARRSRVTFAVLVLLTFLFVSLCGAVLGAAVVGFLLAGVYQAGGFSMSTWIPFIWAVIQGLVALLGIWPSVIDII
ncbi:hypothetical protein BJ138DRAFT_131366 [Hygrophoropsis aurantiaca]|uniref:Uncharacterized protein n=1 Tax=Hygrophoropsis aurantiaca TaxID=72124 RepID=A0ACB7ZRI4_9AGAM|nr:hypothetical protein BJ138DRAFT_131366 [Hygrophoropsis aurantiaca]